MPDHEISDPEVTLLADLATSLEDRYADDLALVPPHGGRAGRDTKWLSFPAVSAPEWLEPYGGTLSQVHRLIMEATR